MAPTAHTALTTVETWVMCIYTKSEGTLSLEQRPGGLWVSVALKAYLGRKWEAAHLDQDPGGMWPHCPTNCCSQRHSVQVLQRRLPAVHLSRQPKFIFLLCGIVWICFAVVGNSCYASLWLKGTLLMSQAKARKSKPLASCHCPSLDSWSNISPVASADLLT